jgi:hypothetical protein
MGIPPAKDFPKVIKSGVKLKCDLEPVPGYFEALEKICREHGILIAVDDIQQGFGRIIISLRPTIADMGIPPAKDFPKVIKSGVKLKCETELHLPVRPKPC